MRNPQKPRHTGFWGVVGSLTYCYPPTGYPSTPPVALFSPATALSGLFSLPAPAGYPPPSGDHAFLPVLGADSAFLLAIFFGTSQVTKKKTIPLGGARQFFAARWVELPLQVDQSAAHFSASWLIAARDPSPYVRPAGLRAAAANKGKSPRNRR